MAVVTKTLKSTGGDYSLMSTWESTEQTDLVSDGDTHVLECYNDWVSGLDDSVTITGWTTSATYYITVQAAAGHGHGGVPGAGFTIKKGQTGTDILSIKQDYTVVEDIEVINSNAGFTSGASCFLVERYSTVKNCIASIPNSTGGTCYAYEGGYQGGTFINCLVFDVEFCGFLVPSSYACYLYNCTAINSGDRGFYFVSGTNLSTIKNCVSYGHNTADFTQGSAYVAASHNASGDATAPGTSPQTGVTSADFVDYAGGDYTPTSSGALAGTGTDLSAYFLDDITGTAR